MNLLVDVYQREDISKLTKVSVHLVLRGVVNVYPKPTVCLALKVISCREVHVRNKVVEE